MSIPFSLEDELQRHFGRPSFIGFQREIIARILEKPRGLGNSLVIMPTGGGKSLCYQLPALLQNGGTLIISPLIALMQDQVDALRKRGIPASFINATVQKQEKEERLAAFVSGKLKLLYVTPERFKIPDFVEGIRRSSVDLLAVDEAHCISEWGQDFRPDYTRLADIRMLLGNPSTLALTATATKRVREDILQRLGITENTAHFVDTSIRKNLELNVLECDGDDEKRSALLELLGQQKKPAIVYFSLIKTLKAYSQATADRGHDHVVYHGDLDARQRKRMQRAFLEGSSNLVLATNAFGLGIDKPDIRTIVHAEVPGSVEAYYQEIGRAGRDGQQASCILLYDQQDLVTQMDFIKWSNPGAPFYRGLFQLIEQRPQEANTLGIEFLREQLTFKNRRDFRVDTALRLFERYGVTEGSVETKNLRVIAPLPDFLSNETKNAEKLLSDQKRLYAVVQYVRSQERRGFLREYFA